MVCILYTVMGCLATKEYKSSTEDIRDDVVKKVSVGGGGVAESNGYISDTTTNNGTANNKLDVKKNILGKPSSPKQETPTSPTAGTTTNGGLTVKKNERFFTQSQIDFFEMLDKKINAGKDYISEEHPPHAGWPHTCNEILTGFDKEIPYQPITLYVALKWLHAPISETMAKENREYFAPRFSLARRFKLEFR